MCKTLSSRFGAAAGWPGIAAINVGGYNNDPPSTLPRATGQSPGRRMSVSSLAGRAPTGAWRSLHLVDKPDIPQAAVARLVIVDD